MKIHMYFSISEEIPFKENHQPNVHDRVHTVTLNIIFKRHFTDGNSHSEKRFIALVIVSF